MEKRTIIILGASSDIGFSLTERYLKKGHIVIGTYRNKGLLQTLEGHRNLHLFALDFKNEENFITFKSFIEDGHFTWDQIIVSTGTMEPIGPFLDIDGYKWRESIDLNALLPCLLLKSIYPLKSHSKIASACFMAGGGTNNAFRNYSAYCISKIVLIKMCELLADEIPDLKSFIIGPGYIKSKIHMETLKAGNMAGENLAKTKQLLQSEGTSLDDVFECIEWCIFQPASVINGRNISVVHDEWRDGGKALAAQLNLDEHKFKLRRFKNT